MSVHRLYLPVTSCILPVTVRHHSHPQQSRTILRRILCLLPPATFHCIFTHEHNINNIHFYTFPTVPQIFTGVNHHVKIPMIMFISLPNTAGRWGHARHCRNFFSVKSTNLFLSKAFTFFTAELPELSSYSFYTFYLCINILNIY